jgi:hypothetical protein
MAVTYQPTVCQQGVRSVTAHDWQPTASAGWHRCARCGQVGVCLRCLLEAGVAHVPFGPMRLECERHAQVVPPGRAGDGNA